MTCLKVVPTSHQLIVIFMMIHAQEGKFCILEEVTFHFGFGSLALLLEYNCCSGLPNWQLGLFNHMMHSLRCMNDAGLSLATRCRINLITNYISKAPAVWLITLIWNSSCSTLTYANVSIVYCTKKNQCSQYLLNTHSLLDWFSCYE